MTAWTWKSGAKTVPAAGTVDVDVPARGVRNMSLVLKNTGAVALTVSAYKLARVGGYEAADTALASGVGTLAAATVAPAIEAIDLSCVVLRLRVACAGAGTTCEVEASGNG